MTTIHIFPGQGSQAIGMGRELFPKYPHLLAQADAVLKYSIAELCLDGPDERLNDTRYTQPALFVVCSLSYLEQVRETGVLPQCVAGHSLGEYSALFAAGVFDFAMGVELVQARGALMAAPKGGAMAAVLGLPLHTIEALCRDECGGSVDIANVNGPSQTVISGRRADVDALSVALERAGAQVVRLKVSAAFHSRHMAEASAEFANVLARYRFRTPTMDVVSNVTAAPYAGGDSVAEGLCAQITHRVRWSDSVRLLLSQPEPVITEIGPGRVLSALVRQIQAGNAGALTTSQ